MNDYPPEWKNGTLQIYIRERAEHQCEHCGMAFDIGTNLATEARNANGEPSIGTVHHINGDKADCSYENLVYLCQACHLHVQASWQPGQYLPIVWEWDGVPDWIIKRDLPYKETGQLRLL